MKFLILATCVCVAVAAPQQRFAQPFARATAVAVSPFVSATQVTANAAQVTANEAQVTANAAQDTYNTAKATYNTAKATWSGQNVGVAAVKFASGNEAEAPIVRSESDVRPDGFNYIIETANGIKSEATGELKQIGDTAAVVVRGQYSYTGADGVPVLVTYVADENGFQPQSDSIPVAPPVPEAIARSLQYIAAHPEQIKRF